MPKEYTSSPNDVAGAKPVGPPHTGIEGFTDATSAGSMRMRAKSLYAQVSRSVSPTACMVSQEL